uniref:Uncharacterized protein n=1 Tax=Monodelphis domestica TaxID=13616 RepID=A0A5F8GX97_MONDO
MTDNFVSEEDNYDGDNFDDVEEDEGLDDLKNPKEEARVLGTWALHIAIWAPVMMELEGEMDYRHKRTQGSKNPQYHLPLPDRWEL